MFFAAGSKYMNVWVVSGCGVVISVEKGKKIVGNEDIIFDLVFAECEHIKSD